MKTNHPHRLLKIFSLAVGTLALLIFASPQKAEARTSVSFNMFYDGLQAHGDWVETDDYGYAWSPNVYDDDWSPYSDGYWAYTDCGWTWVSEEPWGWATYHYGRWVLVHGRGWLWVPGYEWAPAWVSWRYSDNYVGWAPLPPEAIWHRRSGFGISVDISFGIGSGWYNFVGVRDFCSPRLRQHIYRRDRNVTIINQTKNVTKIVYNNSTIINNGPDVAAIERRSNRRVERLQLDRTQDATQESRRAQRRGNRLEVFAPEVRPAADSEAPRNVKERLGRVERNRGDIAEDTGREARAAKRNQKQAEVTPTANVVAPVTVAPENVQTPAADPKVRRAERKRNANVPPPDDEQVAPEQTSERIRRNDEQGNESNRGRKQKQSQRSVAPEVAAPEIAPDPAPERERFQEPRRVKRIQETPRFEQPQTERAPQVEQQERPQRQQRIQSEERPQRMPRAERIQQQQVERPERIQRQERVQRQQAPRPERVQKAAPQERVKEPKAKRGGDDEDREDRRGRR